MIILQNATYAAAKIRPKRQSGLNMIWTLASLLLRQTVLIMTSFQLAW